MKGPEEIARNWLEAANEHDVDKMGSLCWEDVVGDEVVDPPPAEGLDQLSKSYRELFEGFPDCKSEVLNLFSGQEQVVAEIRWSGTNLAEFRGEPATNKFVDIRIAYIFRVENGKIRRITEYYDGAAVASQMEGP